MTQTETVTVKLVPIEKIKVGTRLRTDLGDIDTLAETIEAEGLLQPIVLNQKLELKAGERRLAACKKLGWKQIPATIIDSTDSGPELIENLAREQFTPREIAGIIERYDLCKQGRRTDLAPRSAKFLNGRTRDIIAKLTGLSKKKSEDLIKLAKKAKEDPQRWGPYLDNVNLKSGTNIRYITKMINAEERSKEPRPELPEGQFDVILADPPWQYQVGLRADPQDHYLTQKTEAIAKIKVPAAPDAVLFLWATMPKIEDALYVMKEWRFNRHSGMVWVKMKNGKLQSGTGYYFRGNAELLLVGTRGIFQIPLEKDRQKTTIIVEERTIHSAKPKIVYQLIEKMYPNRKYVELFSRNKEGRKGWTMHGDELNDWPCGSSNFKDFNRSNGKNITSQPGEQAQHEDRFMPERRGAI